MARVEVARSLALEIKKRFDRAEANTIIDLMESLEENPHKGKTVGNVGGIVIKELKYKKYRFYFIVDGQQLRCYDEKTLIELLLRFVRMSDKKTQQKTIEEIRVVLRTIGPQGLN